MEFPWDAEDGPEPKKPDGINDAFSAFLQRYGHYVKVDDPWNDPVHPEIALADPTQQQRWLDRLAETIEMHRARRREAKAEAFAFWERLGPTVAPPREGVKAYMRRKSLDDFLAQIGPNAPVSRPGDYLPPNADLSARIDRWWRERLMVNALKRLRRGVEHRDIARVERAVAWARRAIRGIFLVEGPWGAGALHHAEGDLPARTETDHAAYRQKLARFALKRSLVRDGKELGTSADGWRTPLRIIGPGGTLDRPRRTRVLPRPFKDDARDPERLPYGQPCPDRIDAPPSPPPCPGLDPDHRYPRPTIKESEHVVGSGGWRY
jgi:hypothetical protein